ncbi:MAG: hypothetical protein R2713_13465 [Ilumatobacteraceae bacterium]
MVPPQSATSIGSAVLLRSLPAVAFGAADTAGAGETGGPSDVWSSSLQAASVTAVVSTRATTATRRGVDTIRSGRWARRRSMESSSTSGYGGRLWGRAAPLS